MGAEETLELVHAVQVRNGSARGEALESLREALRRPGSLPPLDKLSSALALSLHDPNWNVRKDALSLLSDLLQGSGANLATHIIHLLPALIMNMADTKIALKKAAAATLLQALQVAADSPDALDVFVSQGLENPDPKIRIEALHFLSAAAPWKCPKADETFPLVEGVVGRLRDVDQEVVRSACQVLALAPQYIGKTNFDANINQMVPPLKQLYHSIQEAQRNSVNMKEKSIDGSSLSRGGTFSSWKGDVELGFIPTPLMAALRDDQNWQGRTKAVEELQGVIVRLENTGPVLPHLPQILDFLTSLLGDQNLQVTTAVLQVLGLLVGKVGWPIRTHLEALMVRLLPMLGDTKIVVRQSTIKLLNKLMQTLTPAPILNVLLGRLSDPNWRVREEIINVVILSVSSFPSEQFDFYAMAAALLPAVKDSKSRVKYVAIEAFAVLNKILGTQQLVSLLESMQPSQIVMKTLQARFDSTEVPSVSSEGLVEHLNRSETPSSQQSSSADLGLDRRTSFSSTAKASMKSLPWAGSTLPSNRQAQAQQPTEPATQDSFLSSFRSNRSDVSTASISTTASTKGAGGSYQEIYKTKLEGRLPGALSSSPSAASLGYDPATESPPKASLSAKSDGYLARARARSKQSSPTFQDAQPQQQQASAPLHRPPLSFSAGSQKQTSSTPAVPHHQQQQQHQAPSGLPWGGKVSSLEDDTSTKRPAPRPSVKERQDPLADDAVVPFTKARLARPQSQRNSSSSSSVDTVEAAYRPRFDSSSGGAPVAAAPPAASTVQTTLMRSSIVRRNLIPAHDEAEPEKIELTDKSVAGVKKGNPSSSSTSAPFAVTAVANPSGRVIEAKRFGFRNEEPKIAGHSPGNSTASSFKDAAQASQTEKRTATEKAAPIRPEEDIEGTMEGQLFVLKTKSIARVRGAARPASETLPGNGAAPSDAPVETTAVPIDGSFKESEGGADPKAGAGPLLANSTLSRISNGTMRARERTIMEKEKSNLSRTIPPEPAASVLPAEEPAVVPTLQRSRTLVSNGNGVTNPNPNPNPTPNDPGRPPSRPGLARPDSRSRFQRASRSRVKSGSGDDGAEPGSPSPPLRDSVASSPGPSSVFGSEPSSPLSTQPLGASGKFRNASPVPEEGPDMDATPTAEPRPVLAVSVSNRLSKKKPPPLEPAVVPVLDENQAPSPQDEMAPLSPTLTTPSLAHDDTPVGKGKNADEWWKSEGENGIDSPASASPMRAPLSPRAPKNPPKPRKPVRSTSGPSLQVPSSDDTSPPEDVTEEPKTPTGAASSVRRTVQSSAKRVSSTTTDRRSSVPGAERPTPTRQGAKGPANTGDAYLMDFSELTEIGNPPGALKDAQDAIAKGENQELWIQKCEGLTILRRLTKYHPEFVVANLREVLRMVMQEVKNLRSSVSRVAIAALVDMFVCLGKSMEKDLETTVSVLQHKAGAEASVFIKDEVDQTLMKMVENVTATKAVTALFPLCTHKNKDIRRTSSKYIAELIPEAGPRFFAAREHERLIHVLASICQDQTPDTRFFGKKIVYELLAVDAFEAAVTKVLTGTAQLSVIKVIEDVKNKGPPEEPSAASTTSSTVRRATSQRSTSRNSRSALQAPSPAKKAGGEIDAERLKALSKQLAASDYKQREVAVEELEKIVTSRPDEFINSGLNLLFDFAPRLTDMNAKVNLRALKALCNMVPCLTSNLDTVMGELLPPIAQSLTSKNQAISQQARETLSAIVRMVEPSHLAQPMSACVKNANPVVKEALVCYVADLIGPAFARNPKLLSKHLIPLAVNLLEDKRLRSQSAQVWQALHQHLGDSLYDEKSIPDSHREAVKALL